MTVAEAAGVVADDYGEQDDCTTQGLASAQRVTITDNRRGICKCRG